MVLLLSLLVLSPPLRCWKDLRSRLRYLSDLSSNGLADPMVARAVIQVRINRLVLLRGGAVGLAGGLMVLVVVGVEW